nr:M48 family metalloprotease [Spirochaetota bacterium]
MEQRLRIILAGVIGVLGVLLAAGILGSVHPADFAAAQRYFSIAEIIRSRSYFIHGVVPVMVLRMVVFGLLVTAIIKRWTILPLCVKKRGWKTYINNAFSIFVLLAVLELLRFPAAFYAGYLREGEFGLRNAGFSLWLYRYGFSSLISFVALWGMLSVFMQFLAGTKRFIIFIPLVFFVLSMGATVLLPRLITPLFYEVSSLENVELRSRIQGIMERTGLPVSDIKVVHTSRYSKKVNAYFTGFGKSREIYLYDTLLNNFSIDEIITVVSHELCHYNEEHVLIGLFLVSAGIAAGLAVMMLLSQYLFGA